jgi:CheY-like chemotaxis protein
MKILILNPHVDAQHSLVQVLQRCGAAVLLTPNVDQAAQVLQFHGSTVDIALVHREGGAGLALDYGLSLLLKLKSDPSQADLPVLVTSERWHDPEFLNHQATPLGANGYIHWPCDEAELLKMISAIVGTELVPRAEEVPGERVAGTRLRALSPSAAEAHAGPALEMPAAQPVVQDSPFAPQLVEDASQIYTLPAGEGTGGILLDAPEVAAQEPAVQAPAPASAGPRAIPVPPPFRGSTRQIQTPEQPAPPAFGQPTFEIPSQVSIVKDLTSAGSPEGVGAEPRLEIPAEPVLAPPDAPPGGIDFSSEPNFELSPTPAPASTPSALDLNLDEAPVAPSAPPQDDAQLAQELPYLFGRGDSTVVKSPHGVAPSPLIAHPVGDAVVPGGAAQSPDTETLKKYLMLREQDVSALSAQLRAAQNRIAQQEQELAVERARTAELTATANEQKRRIESFETEKAIALENVQTEINELKFQARAKSDKAKLLEIQVRAATEEMEKLKERVRSDIRKIRIREKELENRLEIMRKDSEVLISTRETRIIELKRKLDLMEFNMDLLQNQLSREKDHSAELKKRLAKAAQVVRVAGGLLGPSLEGLATEAGVAETEEASTELKTRAS